jgi:3-oxoacyl-[acyl-carrier-protein] synthase II
LEIQLMSYFKAIFGPKEVRKGDRFILYGRYAARMAFEDAKLEGQFEPERMSVLVGSGIGGLETIEKMHDVLMQRGARRVTPFLIPAIIPNLAAGQVSIDLGAKGANFCISSACATGAHCIGEAMWMIRNGRTDVAIAGGTEAGVAPLALAGFGVMRALSTRNDDPQAASRPFDSGRDGFVLGEGAGILVLEELEHAKRRGARIYAEVAGYGANSDAHHITQPLEDGAGVVACMTQALRDAGCKPESVSYINGHATSTPQGDIQEINAIKTVFGEHAQNLCVSATKSMVGHLLGAAGGFEALVTALSVYHQKVHPTINMEEPDPLCDLDCVSSGARDVDIDVAISNSFGFGGTNATVVLKKYQE